MDKERHLELQKRFKEHFELVDASALVVLKGHLLIEEALDAIISKFVFHAEHMEKAALRFGQKVDVARSMSLDEQDNPMWQLPVAINTLRNELAHSLKSEKRRRKTQSVIDLYFKLLDNVAMVEEQKKESEEVLLMWAVAFFMGFMLSFEAEIDRYRSVVGIMDRMFNPHRHKKKPNSDEK